MKNYKDILLTKDSTIKEALKVIETGAMKIALIVDKYGKFIGTLSDGDIRRGLISNLSLNDSIKDIIFCNPTVCKIGDTKEEILEVALEKKIYQIPIVDEHGKLVGVEEVNNLIKPSIKMNKVILMVGGLGSRLRPLTDNIPKPMLKVGNRPILETIILNFKKNGFSEIILCVSYKSEIIEKYFGDGSSFGVNIKYIHENKRMGTAGALSLIQETISEPFFVMNGDLLTNLNFEQMLKFHTEHSSIGTMAVREYDYQVPYGVVTIDISNNIKNIEEKPIKNFFVSGGIYILEPILLKFIPTNQYFDMPTLFNKIIRNSLKCISFPIHEYWIDIGRLDEYEKANNEYNKVFK